eukprot:3005153-Rhodomonas_salina.1
MMRGPAKPELSRPGTALAERCSGRRGMGAGETRRLAEPDVSVTSVKDVVVVAVVPLPVTCHPSRSSPSLRTQSRVVTSASFVARCR